MPPPAAKPSKPKPTFFTPQRPAGGAADAGDSAGATPLFMTPTADVYAGVQPQASDAAESTEGPPPQ